MDERPQVTVEFFGIPRQRAGGAELVVAAATVGEALAAVERECPGLAGLVRLDGRLAPHYLISVDGHRFCRNADQQVQAGERLLLLSADAGG